MSGFTESVVEDAALAWLEGGLGWRVVHGPPIAPGERGAERTDYGHVVLERRLREALARLNPTRGAGAVPECTHQSGPGAWRASHTTGYAATK